MDSVQRPERKSATVWCNCHPCSPAGGGWKRVLKAGGRGSVERGSLKGAVTFSWEIEPVLRKHREGNRESQQSCLGVLVPCLLLRVLSVGYTQLEARAPGSFLIESTHISHLGFREQWSTDQECKWKAGVHSILTVHFTYFTDKEIPSQAC